MTAEDVHIGRLIYFGMEICGAIICFIVTISLIRMLYCSQHSARQSISKQVMHPTSQMKICSISCVFLLFTGFVMKAWMMSTGIDREDMKNVFVKFMYHLGNAFMKCGQALYFKYFVLSMRKLYRSNDIARMAISKPMVIWTEVLIVVNVSVIIIYTTAVLSLPITTTFTVSDKTMAAIVYKVVHIGIAIAIDISLIYCLRSIINNYARNWRFDASDFVNDEQKALLLMMTRYCSIIIISATIDVINTTVQLFQLFIGNHFWRREYQMWTILAGVFECINVSTLAIAIYFSFPFNNLVYETYCYCCHTKIYGAAQRTIALRQQESAGMDGYIMMAGSNINGYEERTSITNSSHKQTDYFSDNLYVE